MGVGPPGHTGRDQLVALRSGLLPRMASATPGGAGTIAICCAQSPLAHRAALESRGATLHLVPCVGNLHSSVVEILIRGGASGVLVAGCPPRDCVGREGPKWLNERLFNDREAELQPRVDRRRLRVTTLAPGALAETLAAYDAFTQHLATLAPPPAEAVDDLSLELLCESVPLDEDAA